MNRLSEIVRLHRVAVLGALVLLLFAGVVLWILVHPQTDVQREAIRKAGYPTTLAELDVWYQFVPDTENGALAFTKAFPLLHVPATSSTTKSLIADIPLPPRGGRLSSGDVAELTSLLVSNQLALEVLRSPGSFTRSRYPLDLKQGFNTLLPHLSQVKNANCLLSAEALLHAENGKKEEAVKSLVAASRAPFSLTAEPLVISQLVRMAGWSLIVSRLERILNLTTLTDEQLALLQKVLSDGEQPQSLVRAFAGERAMGLAVFDGPNPLYALQFPSSSRSDRIAAALGIGLLKATGIFGRDRNFYLNGMSTNLAIAETPYPQHLDSAQKASARLAGVPRFCIISAMLMPALAKLHEKDAEHVARLRVAQAALAVERFRLAHENALPASLDELVPTFVKSVPTDPYDSQKLRFQKKDSGYIIYSIGSDKKDDGGLEQDPKNPQTAHDITFILER